MNNTKPIIKPVAQNLNNFNKPVEIVQIIEVEEQEIHNEKPDHIIIEVEEDIEEEIHEAEVIENEEIHQEKFAYLHEANPRLPDTPFWVKIRFENCYLTDAGYLSYILGLNEKVKSLPINKIEKVKELLSDLETNQVRIVNRSWGYETSRTSFLKTSLKKQLKEIIRGYENGGTIQVNISVRNQ